MKKIKIEQPQDETLVAQLASLAAAFGKIEKDTDKEVEFDLSVLNWACPLLVLPLAAYINTHDAHFIINERSQLKKYFDIIHFPKGINSINDFESRSSASKTYVPISILKRDAAIDRDKLENKFLNMILSLLKAAEGTRNALYYPALELITNIFEHSKESVGYIFGQMYPKKNYLDICILDTGRGLSAAYKEEKSLELTDEQSITEAMRGNSTKKQLGRGYGLRTSKRVVCEGLGGGFMMISGKGALISKENADILTTLPNFYWQGVIIAYRIPRPTGTIDISRYLE